MNDWTVEATASISYKISFSPCDEKKSIWRKRKRIEIDLPCDEMMNALNQQLKSMDSMHIISFVVLDLLDIKYRRSWFWFPFPFNAFGFAWRSRFHSIAQYWNYLKYEPQRYISETLFLISWTCRTFVVFQLDDILSPSHCNQIKMKGPIDHGTIMVMWRRIISNFI